MIGLAKRFFGLFGAGVLIASAVPFASGQISSDSELRKFLLSGVQLKAEDITDLENNKLVAKIMPVSDKREVAVFGITRFEGSVVDGIKAFNLTMDRQKHKTAIKFGRFGNRPSLKDLSGLNLDKKEIRDLERCVVGDCKLRLSRPMIERIQNRFESIDGDPVPGIRELYRQILFEYVTDYVKRGDKALVTYHDNVTTLSLEAEMRSLYSESAIVRNLAPEFFQYVEQFPQHPIENVENSISWSKIKVGLKPVVLITHTFRQRQASGTASQALVLSKQIYANHYFDSSLGLTSVLRISGDDSVPQSYIIYFNLSRSSTLGKGFGRMVRGVVKREALDKLELILTSTRRYAESIARNETTEPVHDEDPNWVLERVFRVISPIWLLLAAFLVILVVLLARNRR